MYETLAAGTKRSLTISINKAFKTYMEQIDWSVEKYNSNDFVNFWMEQSKKHSSWFSDVNNSLLKDIDFQKELLTKVNSIIQKTIDTPPSKEQIETIDHLVKEQNIADIGYCCKMEANYLITKLKK